MTIAVALVAKDDASGPIKHVSDAIGGLEKAATAPIRAIGGLTSALGKLGLAGLGISAVTSAVGGLTDALGLGLNVEMENTAAQLTAFTGSAEEAQKLLAQIRKEADATPFAFQEMAKATASLLPIAKQSGVALMDLVRQAEVLAALNPAEGLVGAAFSLREAMSGDFVSIIDRFNLPRQRLNDLKAQGVPALKAISIALKEMGVDERLVAGLATTLSGRWSTFQDTIAGFRQRAGAGLFAGLKTGLGDLQTLLDDNKDALNELATTIGTVVGRAGQRLIGWGIDAAKAGAGLLRFFQDAQGAGLALHNALERLVGREWGTILVRGFEGLRATLLDLGSLLRGEIDIGDFATRLGNRIVAGVKAFPWSTVADALRAGLVAAIAQLQTIGTELQTWLTASAAEVDWDKVWADARAAQRTSGAVELMFQHTSTNEAAFAVGEWLGRATTQAIADQVTALSQPGSANAVRIGGGLVALARNAAQNAEPATRLTMRAFGLDWAAALVEGVAAGARAGVPTIVAAIRQMIDDALAQARGFVTAIPGRIISTLPPPPQLPPGIGGGGGGGGGAPPAMQHGGVFRVGGAGGIDSRMVSFRATPGEVVAVGHPRGSAGGGPVVLNVANTFHVANRADADYLADVLPDALARALEKARSQQGSLQVGGLMRFA